MMRKTLKLTGDIARQAAFRYIMQAPDGYIADIKPPNRTLEQNADQWPYLEAFAKNVQWPINGVMSWLDAEEWKDILTAAFNQEDVRVAPGLNGGMVMLGQRTSKMPKDKFSDWLEFLHATAAIKGIEPVYKSPKNNASL